MGVGSRRCACGWRRDLFSFLMEHDVKAPRETFDSRGAFVFWRDPVCMGSWALYMFNRYFLAPHFGGQIPFLYEHFNDTLFLPAALPPFLWIRQQLKLREPKGAPTWREVIILTALCSVFFEWLGPKYLGHSVGDWGDVVVYWLGAVVAGGWWNRGRFNQSRD